MRWSRRSRYDGRASGTIWIPGSARRSTGRSRRTGTSLRCRSNTVAGKATLPSRWCRAGATSSVACGPSLRPARASPGEVSPPLAWPRPVRRRERRNEGDPLVDPLAERSLLAGAGRSDEDVTRQRPAGEIHRPGVRRRERLFVSPRTDADHQIVLHDAAEGLSAEQEGESAEHLLLRDFAPAWAQGSSDAFSERFVECHGRSGGDVALASRLDVALETREEAFDACVPFAPDHHRVEELTKRAELQPVLHPLADERSAAFADQRVAVAEGAHRQGALVQFERQRFVRPPGRDPLLEPAARREVASAGGAGTLLRLRDDLGLRDAGIVRGESIERCQHGPHLLGRGFDSNLILQHCHDVTSNSFFPRRADPRRTWRSSSSARSVWANAALSARNRRTNARSAAVRLSCLALQAMISSRIGKRSSPLAVRRYPPPSAAASLATIPSCSSRTRRSARMLVAIPSSARRNSV